jgi:hypothetical protein
MKYLIKFDANWCDEFDCQQFVIVNDCPACYIDDILENEPHYFGTNEGFEPGDLDIENFTIQEMTDGEAVVFEKFFSYPRFGTGVL